MHLKYISVLLYALYLRLAYSDIRTEIVNIFIQICFDLKSTPLIASFVQNQFEIHVS